MYRKIFLIFFLIMFFTTKAWSQQEDSLIKSDSITLRDCINIALQKNPQIKIAEGNYEFNSSSLTETKSILFPQLSFQTGLSRNGGTSFIGPIVREGYYNNFFYGIQANQLIFDFGKSYTKVSASADIKYASEQDLISAKQNLILSTETAFFNFLQAKRINEVSLEVLKQAQEHLKQAEAFYKVGRVAKYDVLVAQTDVANAKVNLISSENNIRISKLQLENILSQKIPGNVQLKDNLEVNQDSIGLESAIETSLQNRPEVISSKFKVDANKELVTSAWLANLPLISATAGYNWRTYATDVPFQNSWNVGLTLSVPIFQGFALDAGIEQAKANLKSAQGSDEALIQAVKLDVQQQFSSLEEAKERIEATRSLVEQAEETLKLAEGRYNQGVGSAVEITDARVTVYNARTSYIQSLYDYQVAYARLKRAMGILK